MSVFCMRMKNKKFRRLCFRQRAAAVVVAALLLLLLRLEFSCKQFSFRSFSRVKGLLLGVVVFDARRELDTILPFRGS